MSLAEYDLPLKCTVIRCEEGTIWVRPGEGHNGYLLPPGPMDCPKCKGLGKLPDLELDLPNKD